MERHIRIEMIGGLAGDMFLAAALDAGLVEREALEKALGRVGLGAVRVHAERVRRAGIAATHVRFSGWDPEHERDHRHLSEITKMLEASGLDEAVKRRAIALFEVLGRAESASHAVPMDRVHFHEVGAVDSLLDFVGAAWVIEQLGASWSAGAVPLGGGVIVASHGPMPALAPATERLLRGAPVRPSGIEGETVTPTGAAILAELGAWQSEGPGASTLVGRGYGAGTREWPGCANVVALTVFEAASGARAAGWREERVARIEAEIDDETPEALAAAAEALMGAGALDVSRAPVAMKKGRLGVRLTVIARPQDADRLAEVMLRRTSTLGARVSLERRVALERDAIEVETRWGMVEVKRAWLGGEAIRWAPEFESVRRVAEAAGVGVTEVRDEARQRARAGAS